MSAFVQFAVPMLMLSAPVVQSALASALLQTLEFVSSAKHAFLLTKGRLNYSSVGLRGAFHVFEIGPPQLPVSPFSARTLFVARCCQLPARKNRGRCFGSHDKPPSQEYGSHPGTQKADQMKLLALEPFVPSGSCSHTAQGLVQAKNGPGRINPEDQFPLKDDWSATNV